MPQVYFNVSILLQMEIGLNCSGDFEVLTFFWTYIQYGVYLLFNYSVVFRQLFRTTLLH